MSNHYDGIELKVADGYRVPRIEGCSDLLEWIGNFHRTTRAETDTTQYDFGLERNVIKKIEEWKRVHDKEEHDRQEMLRARDRERREQIERQQKLLLNQVSYPSAEDLSTGYEDASHEHTNNESSSSSQNKVSASASPVPPISRPGPHANSDFSVILKPTKMPGLMATAKESSTMEPLLANNVTAKGSNGSAVSQKVQSGRGSGQAESMNYSEWETDNYSSPFDRLELNSINDMDILAQVLQLEQKTTTETTPSPEQMTQEESKAVTAEPIETPNPIESKPESSSITPALEMPFIHPPPQVAAVATTSASMVHQNHHHLHHFNSPSHTFQPYQMNGHGHGYCQDYQYNTNRNCEDLRHIPYLDKQQQQFYEPKHSPMVHNGIPYGSPEPYSMDQKTLQEDNNPETTQAGTSRLSLLQMRSKSVPDIVNELNEEVRASEERRKRIRNHSQSVRGEESDALITAEKEDDIAFAGLTEESKGTAMKMSKMGFPIAVVASVIDRLGNDEKTIIEHLIPLLELLDLGFGVNSTSEALLKFNNNRDRALDSLIS